MMAVVIANLIVKCPVKMKFYLGFEMIYIMYLMAVLVSFDNGMFVSIALAST